MPEIFGTAGEGNFVWVKRIARLSPETRISSNLSPTMLLYGEGAPACAAFIGRDARFYHPRLPGIDWNGETQPFGYAGIAGLFRELDRALSSGKESAR